LAQHSKRILVVDDDADTLGLVVRVLSEDGFDVRSCSTGEQALRALKQDPFDLLLADIKLPRLTGIDLLHYVHRNSLDTKVILMTAYASVQSVIQALRGEAFDYIIKPFLLLELRQRVRGALEAESAGGRQHTRTYHGDICIDHLARQVWVGQREVKLTRLEFDLLAYLADNLGRTVSWEELLQEVWKHHVPEQASQASIKSCVCRLRRKLGDDGQNPRYILNVWGIGYKLSEGHPPTET
jgi:DNA-binding response OmpR family regulator